MNWERFWERHRVSASRFGGLALFCIAHPRSRALFALGLLGAFAGEALRFWAAGHIRKGEELARTGPYAMTRNPLYFGSLVMACSFALMCTSLSHWLSSALIWSAIAATFRWPYAQKIRIEEEDLLKKFGAAFEQYRNSVPEMLPDWERWRKAKASNEFSFSRAIANKEHRTVWAILGLAALLRFKMVYRM